MAYVNVTLDVPDELVVGVVDGSKQLMGLLKDSATKQVNKHLNVVSVNKVSDSVVDTVTTSASNSIFTTKNVLIGLGITAFVALTATVTTLVVRHNLKVKEEEKAKKLVASGYNKAISTYIGNAQSGVLSLPDVRTLLAYIESLTKDIDSNQVQIELSSDEIELLKRILIRFTLKLAKANKVDVKKIEAYSTKELTDKEKLETVKECLYVQEDIYAMA